MSREPRLNFEKNISDTVCKSFRINKTVKKTCTNPYLSFFIFFWSKTVGSCSKCLNLDPLTSKLSHGRANLIQKQ